MNSLFYDLLYSDYTHIAVIFKSNKREVEIEPHFSYGSALNFLLLRLTDTAKNDYSNLAEVRNELGGHEKDYLENYQMLEINKNEVKRLQNLVEEQGWHLRLQLEE